MKPKRVLVGSLCLAMFVGCDHRPDAVPKSQLPRSPEAATMPGKSSEALRQLLPQGSPILQADAWATQVAYVRAINAGTEKRGEEIPPACWADGIKALHPIKVYFHRVNIVVVQRISDGTEEGKYIYIPVSSYLPRSGDDGFTFTPDPTDGHTVFDFKRMLSR
jgi:hypothetical protein